MIAMSPFWSWTFLICLGLLGAAAGYLTACYLDEREEWKSTREWEQMREALKFHDWKDDEEREET